MQGINTASVAIRNAIQKLNTHCQYAYLAGEPNWYDEKGEPSNEAKHNGYKSLALVLRNYADECDMLDKHVHEYNDNDYCIHCGADGRA